MPKQRKPKAEKSAVQKATKTFKSKKSSDSKTKSQVAKARKGSGAF